MELASSRKIVAYSDFDSVRKCARLIKDAGQNLSEFSDYIMLTKCDDKHSLPKFELYIDDSLGFTVRLFGQVVTQNS